MTYFEIFIIYLCDKNQNFDNFYTKKNKKKSKFGFNKEITYYYYLLLIYY